MSLDSDERDALRENVEMLERLPRWCLDGTELGRLVEQVKDELSASHCPFRLCDEEIHISGVTKHYAFGHHLGRTPPWGADQ